MELGQAHLTGTIEEWESIVDGDLTTEVIHQIASILADDLVEVLRRNSDFKQHVAKPENQLTLTLNLCLDVPNGNHSQSIIREWPSTS